MCGVVLSPHRDSCADGDRSSDRHVQTGVFCASEGILPPPSGGSPDWGIPCVPQRCPLAESMSVAEPARTSLRRTVCAACGAEFFLYEKMGRRAIVPAGSISEAGSTSEVGGGRKRPSPPPPPKITGIQGDLIPLAGARGQSPRGLALRRTYSSKEVFTLFL